MRYIVILIMAALTLIELRAQTPDLFGVYQVDWGDSPSFRYLILDCDSTYRFITHWDFGGRKDIFPPANETKKWRIDDGKRVVLEVDAYKYRSFEILPDKNLRHTRRKKDLMIKVGTIKSDGSISDFICQFHSENYSLTRFLPGFRITSSETYRNGKLKERRTYHTLTDQEFNELMGNNKHDHAFSDRVMEIKINIGLFETVWPIEKVETWDNDELIIKYFDKSGQEIKVENEQ